MVFGDSYKAAPSVPLCFKRDINFYPCSILQEYSTKTQHMHDSVIIQSSNCGQGYMWQTEALVFIYLGKKENCCLKFSHKGMRFLSYIGWQNIWLSCCLKIHFGSGPLRKYSIFLLIIKASFFIDAFYLGEQNVDLPNTTQFPCVEIIGVTIIT